jgi:hypothetical protein
MPRPAPPKADELLLALPPSALGRQLHLAQRIGVTRGESHWSFEAQLEAEPDEVRVAAFALGQTVARMVWNGVRLEETHSTHVPDAVTPARILSDLQLAWWPEEAVRAGLPAGFAVSTTGSVRAVTRGGQPFAQVRYEGAGPIWPKMELKHLAYGYTLEIESTEAP